MSSLKNVIKPATPLCSGLIILFVRFCLCYNNDYDYDLITRAIFAFRFAFYLKLERSWECDDIENNI